MSGLLSGPDNRASSIIYRFADQAIVLPYSLADFKCGSRVVEYISNLIVERNRQEVLMFVTNSVSLNCLSTVNVLF